MIQWIIHALDRGPPQYSRQNTLGYGIHIHTNDRLQQLSIHIMLPNSISSNASPLPPPTCPTHIPQ